jgi:hypothetical protein
MAMIPQAAVSSRAGFYDCEYRTDSIASPLSHPSKHSSMNEAVLVPDYEGARF